MIGIIALLISLVILGIIFFPGIQLITTVIDSSCGYVETECLLTSNKFQLFLLFLMLFSALSGLIVGIIASSKNHATRNPQLVGKWKAILGFTLNIILFLYGLFALLAAYAGGAFA